MGVAGSSEEEDTLVSQAADTDSSPEDGMWCSRLVEEGKRSSFGHIIETNCGPKL